MKIGCLLLTLSVASIALAVPEPVGKVGDLANLKVTGSKAFTAAQIRTGLLADLEVQIASTPSAPREPFVNLVTRKVTDGFLAAGFPDVKVKAAVEDNQLALIVEEGPRYIAGEIEVTGSQQVDAKTLLAQMQVMEKESYFPIHVDPYNGAILVLSTDQKRDKVFSPWQVGQPARFDHFADDRIILQVREALCQLGYFWSKVTLDRHFKDNIATLVIHLEDKGTQASLGEIEIKGTERNKTSDVIEYLNLKQGMPIDGQALVQMRDKLWRSARFYVHDVLAEKSDAAPGKVKLTIALEEMPKVPLLKEELKPEEIAILRCRDWIAKSLADENEPVMTINAAAGRFKAILHTRHGFLIGAAPPKQPGNDPLTMRTDFSAVVTRQKFGLYCEEQQRKFVTTGGDWRVSADIGYFTVSARNDKPPIQFLIAGGIESGKKEGMALKVNLSPSAFMNIVHPHTAERERALKVELKNGIFSISEQNNAVFRFKEETGELIEISADIELFKFRLTIEPGALQREIDRLEKAIPGKNSYDPDQPLASSAVFLADFALNSPWLARSIPEPQKQTISSVIQKLASTRAFLALQEVLDKMIGYEEGEQFFIPATLVSNQGGPMAFMSAAVPWCDFFFPRQSWPWTMTRESILLYTGFAKHTHLEARRIFNDPDVGPVGFLAAANLYTRASDATSARLFAKRGLDRLTLEYFQKDCRTLCDGNSVHAKFFSALIRSLRELDDKELDALTAVLPKYGPILRALARQPKNNNPAEEVLPPALIQALWEQGMKDILEASLKDLAGAK